MILTLSVELTPEDVYNLGQGRAVTLKVVEAAKKALFEKLSEPPQPFSMAEVQQGEDRKTHARVPYPIEVRTGTRINFGGGWLEYTGHRSVIAANEGECTMLAHCGWLLPVHRDRVETRYRRGSKRGEGWFTIGQADAQDILCVDETTDTEMLRDYFNAVTLYIDDLNKNWPALKEDPRDVEIALIRSVECACDEVVSAARRFASLEEFRKRVTTATGLFFALLENHTAKSGGTDQPRFHFHVGNCAACDAKIYGYDRHWRAPDGRFYCKAHMGDNKPLAVGVCAACGEKIVGPENEMQQRKADGKLYCKDHM